MNSIAIPNNPLPYLAVGWVYVEGVNVWDSSTAFDQWLVNELQTCQAMVRGNEYEERRQAVRAMLRTSGYKPSGRNKPAQEYLVQRCMEGASFPRILPAVDILNWMSIRHGIPISMLKQEAFPEGVTIRVGREGESYPFNAGGQVLELEHLILVCGGKNADEPMGSPIKDSMAGKIGPGNENLACFLYVPRQFEETLRPGEIAQDLGAALKEWVGAKSICWGTA